MPHQHEGILFTVTEIRAQIAHISAEERIELQMPDILRIVSFCQKNKFKNKRVFILFITAAIRAAEVNIY